MLRLIPHRFVFAAAAWSLAASIAPSAHAIDKGADISWCQQMEAQGYIWKNRSGVQQDLRTVLIGLHVNAIRLRTWVNPSSDPINGHCSIDEMAQYAKKATSAGMNVMLDMHFGDTWNSVGTQNPPAAWANDTYSQMLSHMNNYVYHAMNVLKYYGVTPKRVQIGNEINSGICHPVGSISNPSQMTGLLNAAYNEVKAVFPNCLVVVHVAQPQNSSAQTMLDTYKANGGKWDVTGCSSYASLSNQPGVSSAVKNLRTRYGKTTIMCEIGGYASQQASTKQVVTNWCNDINSYSGSAGAVFYWEPAVYMPFDSWNQNAWDSNTKEPLDILTAY